MSEYNYMSRSIMASHCFICDSKAVCSLEPHMHSPRIRFAIGLCQECLFEHEDKFLEKEYV